MTDDLVKRLREAERQYVDNEYNLHARAADRIEELEKALLDVVQYTSRVDLSFFVEPETRKILKELEIKND